MQLPPLCSAEGAEKGDVSLLPGEQLKLGVEAALAAMAADCALRQPVQLGVLQRTTLAASGGH